MRRPPLHLFFEKFLQLRELRALRRVGDTPAHLGQLGADRIGPLWELALLCSITATTAEYAVHLFCDAVLGVRFWDYSATKTDVNGRICLPFSLAWGVLGALAVRLVQPALAALAAGIPSAVTNTVLLCLGIDALWSTGVLLRWGDIDLLAPSRLRRKYRTA